jgi:hypothetical protein
MYEPAHEIHATRPHPPNHNAPAGFIFLSLASSILGSRKGQLAVHVEFTREVYIAHARDLHPFSSFAVHGHRSRARDIRSDYADRNASRELRVSRINVLLVTTSPDLKAEVSPSPSRRALTWCS